MYSPPTPDTFARLLADFRLGDKAATSRLVELLYPELRRLAASKMKGERADHTWQPTLLVNELYLALVKMKTLGNGSLENHAEKAAFLGFAGHLMRRLLIEHSRPLYRRVDKTEFDEQSNLLPPAAESLLYVEQALSRLAAIEPRLRTVVEMRVFEGLSGDEIARQLGCSPRTVANHWTFAKRWLATELADRTAS